MTENSPARIQEIAWLLPHRLAPPPKPGRVAVPALGAKLGKGPGKIGVLTFGLVLIVGVVYAGSPLLSDLSYRPQHIHPAFVLLGIALLVALGIEFVNGFHDTANAWPR